MPITPSKTKVACKSCNLRRVRCDRTDQTPCSRCRTAGQECEPIVSKRGKHKRGRIEHFGFRNSFAQEPATPAASTGSRAPSSEVQADTRTPIIAEPEGNCARDSEAFLVQSKESHTDTTEPRSSRTIYYGDHFNLEYTRQALDDSHEDYIPRMSGTHFLHVDRLGSPTRKLVDDQARKERARLDELGAFDVLDSKISECLIHTFFTLEYPVAPIIDRKEFYLKLESGRVPPLLLQAVYLAAVSHCDQSLLTEAGFDNRYMAMFTFYQKTKALYDAGYESDAIVVLQSLYYLSFWWERPTQQKDMWYWTGIIVNLAQSLGLHQEKTYTRLDEPTRKLWRRIWWSVYSHDIFLALQLGRIPHVNDAYCSTKVLSERDFEEGDLPACFNLPSQPTKERRFYLVYFADLCSRVSKDHLLVSQANIDPSIALRPLDHITTWKSSLPAEIQCRNSTFTVDEGFLASTLNLCFYTCDLLLRRNFFQDPRIMAAGTPAFETATQIVRILENFLSSGLLTACPLRVLPGTFAALSVFITNIRKPLSQISDISAHRARLCMLVLGKLIDYWPPLLLYYPLFARILATRGCHVPDEGVALSAQIQPEETQHNVAASTSGADPATTSDLLMSDALLNDADMFGINSMFPFSAFLNEELLDSDLNPMLPGE
ncbi:fungal-specific transcription factor domain-containing protein [Aspergillus pseudoustus]|uniref:Fungal-specific transcription factor domain-containing protein n=1 Tax=Aspergillus pseudoustus TaxID=1810923 RepID=A0ABR4JYP8_9EURO